MKDRTTECQERGRCWERCWGRGWRRNFQGKLDLFLSGGYSTTYGLSRKPAYQIDRAPASATPACQRAYLPVSSQTVSRPESQLICPSTYLLESLPTTREPASLSTSVPTSTPTSQTDSQTARVIELQRVTVSYSYSKIQKSRVFIPKVIFRFESASSNG